MPSVSWATVDVDVEAAAVTVGAGTPLGSTGWQAFAVDADGTSLGELVVVGWGDITEGLCEPATMSITLRKADTAALALVAPWASEVQIYHDGALMFWGVPQPWSWSTDSVTVTVGMVDVSGWLQHRSCVQDSWADDLLTNGGFESGWDRWSSSGGVLTSAEAHGGTQSVELDAEPEWVRQVIHVHQAMTIMCSAWVMVDSATFAAAGNARLEIEATPRPADLSGKVWFGSAPVTAATPQDQWVRLQCAVTLTPGDWDVAVRVRGVDGTMWVDDVAAEPVGQLRRIDILSVLGHDVTEIDTGVWIRAILLGALPDLNMGVISADSGVTWADEAQGPDWSQMYVSEALDVLRRLGTPSSWRLDVTPSTRTIRLFHPAASQLVHHAGLTIDEAEGVSCAGTMGAARATRVVVLGTNDEWVSVSEPGDDPGGHPVDEIVQAPTGTPTAELAAVGRSHMRSSDDRTLSLTVTGVPMADVADVRPADTLNVSAGLAGPAGAGAYQVVRKRTAPRTGRVTLELVAAPA